MDWMIAALHDPDRRVRRSAVEALVTRGSQVLETLFELLQDTDSQVRYAAAEALGRIGSTRAVPALCAALGDADHEVRMGAVLALRALRDWRAVEPLVATLRDPDEWVGDAAAEALGQLGDPRAVPGLIAALDGPWMRRYSATVALGELGDPRAAEALIGVLRDDYWLATFAIEGLERMGQAAVPALTAALDHPHGRVRARAALTLARLTTTHTLDHLVRTLREADAVVLFRCESVAPTGGVFVRDDVFERLPAHRSNNGRFEVRDWRALPDLDAPRLRGRPEDGVEPWQRLRHRDGEPVASSRPLNLGARARRVKRRKHC